MALRRLRDDQIVGETRAFYGSTVAGYWEALKRVATASLTDINAWQVAP